MSDSENLTHEYLRRHPDEAAQVLEGLDPADAAACLVEADPALAALVMDHMLPWMVAEAIQFMENPAAAERLQGLSSFRAVRVLRLLPKEVSRALKKLLPDSKRKILERQMVFPPNTVGAWMDAFVPTLPDTSTVEEALHYVRRLRRHWTQHVCLMGRDGQFRGMVSLSRVISAANNSLLRQLVDPALQALSSQATLSSVESHPAWDLAPSLPVINPQSRIEGLLRLEQLREGMGQVRTVPAGDTGWATGLAPLFTTAATAWTHCLIALALGEADPDSEGKSS